MNRNFQILADESDIPEIPDHKLDVEFSYELVCSDALLKYVTPEVTFTDAKGVQRTVSVESGMWEGNEHKTWKQIIHYDSLNVSNTATVKYVSKSGVAYQDESDFESVHNLTCLITIKEDGDGRRNNHTIIPETPPIKTTVKADALENFINRLCNSSLTRGGAIDMKGEITKIENEK
ncbi:hypothetical protein [Xylanibacter muris]|uniref:Uncharacterized protein n=1 Tax=Xylanibacter muris TaxID=2736290 RepID=A0ABX2AMP2_9BACT|nr:hypothetical protein [Xylanibacter muris]NPD92390.1 hypothetical protein [Xylanibacter muris]